ncbi:MAG: DUF1592 domain-containing protein [Verrucomicrobiia bacterium]|jgi:hypothetical protein
MRTSNQLLICLLLSIAAPLSAVRPQALMPERHRAFFENYCLDCHDGETRKGSVDLESLPFDLGTLPAAELWQKVLNSLNSGEMPPRKKTQPPAIEKAAFLEDLSKQVVVARKLLGDSGGVITMRRLNRREYVHTMRELLGVEVDAANLPSDSNAGGFDTSGASLFFSSDQFEQYLRIARLALDEVIVGDSRPKKIRIRTQSEIRANQFVGSRHRRLKKSWDRAQQWRASDKPPTAFGFIDADRVKFEEGQYRDQTPGFAHYLSLPETRTGIVLCKLQAGAILDVAEFPAKAAPGRYRIRARVGRLDSANRDRAFLEYGTVGPQAQTGEMDVLGCREITGSVSEPQTIQVEFDLSSSGSRSFALRERQPNIRSAARSDYRNARQQKNPFPDPVFWVDWIEIEGPMIEDWPPVAHRELFFKGPDAVNNDQYAREIIARFAKRAFRTKKPRASFIASLMALYRTRLNLGETFEEALKEPLSVILSATGFLYLREPGADQSRNLKSEELAVRLSYLLWSAPPDQRLRTLATRGELTDAKVLRRETDRLLDSPKSWNFISGFAHQWLDMERLDFFQFNYRQYGEFDDSVKKAARNEIYHTIDTILRERLRVTDLLAADYVVINDLLADYYGIGGVAGEQFRRVSLPRRSARGGLLGMAAVHAMGSDGERTSPVERGAWILRKLLHDPPPPAPPNVPQLSRLDGQLLSARAMQQAHMEEPQCAQCHRKIDPLGFGLENFNAVGQWRTEEVIAISDRRGRSVRRKSLPIEAGGAMSDGTGFKDFFELREQIAGHSAAFSRGFTEALIEYGLGRPYGFSDQNLADQIIRHAASKQNQMREYLHALVQSPQFRIK